MLKDEEFSSRAKVDRYGRRLPKDSGKRELEKFYRVESGSEADEDEEVERELERVGAEEDRELSSETESSSDEDSLEEEGEDSEEVFGILDQQEGEDGVPQGEVSSRLAVVNLDWDNIRAVDLVAVFSSFVPSGGRILKISIYPSEFGKERIEREEMNGPPKEIFGNNRSNGDANNANGDGEDGIEDGSDGGDEKDAQIKSSLLIVDRGEEFNAAKLRRYQLQRLRYYYAVLICNSPSTASAIYTATDGTEYLSTANFFDLRYIPDSVSFAEDRPRDECERVPDGYRPNEFVTSALQHSRVKLGWDADDAGRKEAVKRAFGGGRGEVEENDLKAYLASESENEGAKEAEPEIVDATGDVPGQAEGAQRGGEEATLAPKLSKKEAERQKMRALLGIQAEPTARKPKADRNAPVGDIQITFSSGLSSAPNKGSVFENSPERDETSVEKYVRKEKERNARRKEKMKSKGNNNNNSLETGTEEATEAVLPADESAPEDNISEEAHNNNAQDLGFNDPFFTSPTTDKPTTSAQLKAARKAERAQRTAEEAANAAQRTELELLMVDDKNKSVTPHFDMAALAKAEKALRKVKGSKKSKKRLSEREKAALEAKERDTFEMDVGDERFRDVFERAEFAIDPSHPKFEGTEGMRRLLEEGRRKRKGRGEEEEDEVGEVERKRRRREGKREREDDLLGLVAKVKRKVKG